MNRTSTAFFALLAILFIGQMIVRESFKDTKDSSDNTVTLSLTDLLALVGKTTEDEDEDEDKKSHKDKYSKYEYYKYVKDSILDEVRDALGSELLNNNGDSAYDSINNSYGSCGSTVSTKQGQQFLNSDDYIRKDSVPCYGCSLP